MPASGNENWGQSVGCIVLRNNEVLLAKHTYGKSKGQYCLPGGYLNVGETPQNGAVREMREELNIETSVRNILAVRFNPHDWYIVFIMDYISGELCPDGEEVSEASFIKPTDALKFDEITGFTRTVIEMLVDNPSGALMKYEEYGSERGDGYSLYGVNKNKK